MPTRRSVLALLAAAPAALRGLVAPAAARAAPLPVARMVVAGTHHHAWSDWAAWIAPGDALALRRQPSNPYDPNAVEVLAPGGARIGYVPRRLAARLAPRLDAGERAEAHLERLWEDRSRGEPRTAPREPEALALWRTTAAPGDPVLVLSSADGDPLRVADRTVRSSQEPSEGVMLIRERRTAPFAGRPWGPAEVERVRQEFGRSRAGL